MTFFDPRVTSFFYFLPVLFGFEFFFLNFVSTILLTCNESCSCERKKRKYFDHLVSKQQTFGAVLLAIRKRVHMAAVQQTSHVHRVRVVRAQLVANNVAKNKMFKRERILFYFFPFLLSLTIDFFSNSLVDPNSSLQNKRN